MDSPEHDVIAVEAGNAVRGAALSAREHGARAVVLACAPEAEAGGNTRRQMSPAFFSAVEDS